MRTMGYNAITEAIDERPKKGGEMMAKTERVNLRLTPEMKDKLQKAADAENRTLTNYIENLIIKEWRENGKGEGTR